MNKFPLYNKMSKNESIVYNYIKEHYNKNKGVKPIDISKGINIPMRKLSGIISKLVKRKLIVVEKWKTNWYPADISSGRTRESYHKKKQSWIFLIKR